MIRPSDTPTAKQVRLASLIFAIDNRIHAAVYEEQIVINRFFGHASDRFINEQAEEADKKNVPMGLTVDDMLPLVQPHMNRQTLAAICEYLYKVGILSTLIGIDGNPDDRPTSYQLNSMIFDYVRSFPRP